MKTIGDFIESKDAKIPDAKYTFSDDIELKDSEDEHENGADYANSEIKAQVTDLDDEDTNSKSSATTSQSTITSKFRENLKFTLSKFNLKMPKLTKSLSAKSPVTPEILVCRRCSKQIYPLHLSQRVMNLAQLTDNEDDISAKVIEDVKPEIEKYCECESGEDDDAISINVHTYCDLDGVSITKFAFLSQALIYKQIFTNILIHFTDVTRGVIERIVILNIFWANFDIF